MAEISVYDENASPMANDKPSARRAVILINLGSPASTDTPDVARYLKQFLMDPCVLDTAYPIRWFLVNVAIVPKRARESAEAYRAIWTDEGSPLVAISRRVRDLLSERRGDPVALGMRYGAPSIEDGLREAIESHPEGLDEILAVPLYPQFAMSSYETVVRETRRAHARLGSTAALKFTPPFYGEDDYIEAMVDNAREDLAWEYDHMLFSFHGLPERHMHVSDPTGNHCFVCEDCCTTPSPAHATCYRAQAFQTADLFVERAGIPEGKWSISFQSRLGSEPWLKPYTDFEFERLAKEGVKKLLVISPAFVSDCLETLEELGIRGKRSFIEAGGRELRLIPCMNENSKWIDALERLCRKSY